MRKSKIVRGDLFYVEFSGPVGSHGIQGIRPAVVVSNDRNNQCSPCVTVVPMTGQKKRPLPTHVPVTGHGLPRPSTALAEQVRLVDKTDLKGWIGTLAGTEELREIERALKRQLDVA